MTLKVSTATATLLASDVGGTGGPTPATAGILVNCFFSCWFLQHYWSYYR